MTTPTTDPAPFPDAYHWQPVHYIELLYTMLRLRRLGYEAVTPDDLIPWMHSSWSRNTLYKRLGDLVRLGLVDPYDPPAHELDKRTRWWREHRAASDNDTRYGYTLVCLDAWRAFLGKLRASDELDGFVLLAGLAHSPQLAALLLLAAGVPPDDIPQSTTN